jgi:hypothetical protein
VSALREFVAAYAAMEPRDEDTAADALQELEELEEFKRRWEEAIERLGGRAASLRETAADSKHNEEHRRKLTFAAAELSQQVNILKRGMTPCKVCKRKKCACRGSRAVAGQSRKRGTCMACGGKVNL